jgi:hypothetical protein
VIQGKDEKKDESDNHGYQAGDTEKEWLVGMSKKDEI